MSGHSVLDDDASNDHADGRAEVAHDAKHGSAGGHVGRLQAALDGDHGSLKVGAYADAYDDLKDDNARPALVCRQVYEETEAQRRESHPAHYIMISLKALLGCSATRHASQVAHAAEIRTRNDTYRRAPCSGPWPL